ncbi:MAG TPA: nitroreductase [Ideonella sp.]|uniref:nitroreductase family protein n=1 Tax=Ideonella sp. TaxID=1929293 RepID=UPI002E34F6B2|nr:nitroreductase [Ideonella sp.]HEX5684454.1 nitroreductase [Ideonella sp.]
MPDSFGDAPLDDDFASRFDGVLHARQHVGPKHLGEPAPDEATLRELFAAAAAAPDHGRLRPWRFLVLGAEARERLGQAFADALRERDPGATPEQSAEANDKAFRGPVLILAIADLRADEPDVPPPERLVSLGAAIQNLMLAAAARGYASGLSSGRAMGSRALREAFGLAEGEHAICFISLGTALRDKPVRPRPAPDDFVRWI